VKSKAVPVRFAHKRTCPAAQNYAPQAPGRPLSHDLNSAGTGKPFLSARPEPSPEYVNNKRVSATNTDSPPIKPDIGGIEPTNRSTILERYHCGHERARHYGYTGQDGACDRCFCSHFKPRSQEAAEAEARLVNTTLKHVFDVMATSTKAV